MNGRLAKKIRKELRKKQREILNCFREIINSLSLSDRIRLALKIVIKNF